MVPSAKGHFCRNHDNDSIFIALLKLLQPRRGCFRSNQKAVTDFQRRNGARRFRHPVQILQPPDCPAKFLHQPQGFSLSLTIELKPQRLPAPQSRDHCILIALDALLPEVLLTVRQILQPNPHRWGSPLGQSPSDSKNESSANPRP